MTSTSSLLLLMAMGSMRLRCNRSRDYPGHYPLMLLLSCKMCLTILNGTKESIKGAKSWFMQRLPFAPALAEALRERVFTLDDSERQLHIIFLVNDILFERYGSI